MGVVQAIARRARRLEPTCQALIEAVRSSRAVAPDETGWRIGGQKAWLWAFAGENVTVFLIARGRGYEQAGQILGGGLLGRAGARRVGALSAVHRRQAPDLPCAPAAADQRAARRLRRASRTPPGESSRDALALREQRDVIDADEFGPGVRDLRERTDKLLAVRPTLEPNRRLLGHLATEREQLFTFLTEPGVQATNWRAEQALRPAIVNRKSWGGNRTWQGARTQQITISVIRTTRQQNIDPVERMASAQHPRQPAASN